MNDWKETMVNASRPVRWAAAAALGMLAIFLLVATIDGLHNWGHEGANDEKTITVTGTGTANAVPDTATISFTASATAADVATAEKNMVTMANAALANVKAAGIADSDVTTSSYNVSPHYESTCSGGTYCLAPSTKTSGYDVSESVTVKVHDTSKVADVLAGLAKAGVTNVSGPDFVVDDTQKVIQDARQQAISKAQADAQVLAKQLGVSLGKVVSFNENNNSPVPYYKANAMAAGTDASVATPTIPVGQNEYTDTVSITYEIN